MEKLWDEMSREEQIIDTQNDYDKLYDKLTDNITGKQKRNLDKILKLERELMEFEE